MGSEKWQFLLRFSTIYADVGWLGESEKVQKHADVILEWPLRPFIRVQMGKKMKKFHIPFGWLSISKESNDQKLVGVVSMPS